MCKVNIFRSIKQVTGGRISTTAPNFVNAILFKGVKHFYLSEVDYEKHTETATEKSRESTFENESNRFK